ncbi:MAG: hypothetical protein ACREQA_13065 [Candidatus Binatia bacterium]
MRLLLYGFGPYLRFKENITEKLLNKLPGKKGLKKVVFPVRFQKGQFIKTMKRYNPDVVLGLGQRSRGRRLKIELKAGNQKRKDKREKPRSIVPGGPERLRTSLELNGIDQARISYDAGNYVCNYSMYVILDYLRRNRLPTRFGFIHIPHHYNVDKAIRFLRKALKQIRVG